MNADMTPFDFEGQSVRVVAVDGEPWFVAADVAVILGYRMASDMTRRLDPEDRGTRSVRTPSGDQDMTVISEPGLYVSVLGSKVRGAKAFKRWVTHEVIPSIRKTGSYGVQRELTPDEIVHQALQITAERVERLTAELAIAQPKADTWDALCSGKGDLTITDAAKVLARAGIETGPRKLHQQMLRLGWIYQNARGKWIAKQDRLNQGLLAERVRHYIDDDGVTALATPQVRVTAKGLDRLRVALGSAEPMGALA